MSQPPWIHSTKSMFAPEPTTSGNNSANHAKIYGTDKWKRLSIKYRSEIPMTCQHPGCIALAEMVDHRIRIADGGSIWDRRNWRKLCNHHHAVKRGKERHGYREEAVGTKWGKIPKDMEHEAPDVAGESYLLKSNQ